MAAARRARAPDEREILATIRVSDVARIHAAPVLLHSLDAQPVPIVGLHVSGRHFCLSIDETRVLADAVRAAGDIDQGDDLAAGLDAVAGMLDLMVLQNRLRSAREASWWAAQ